MLNWRTAIKHYREGGSSRVLEVLCARGAVPNWLLYYYEINILSLQRLNFNAIKRRANRYDYGTARKQDAEELAAISGSTETGTLRQLFERFFDHGNQCFVVRKDGAIVGYNWLCHSRYTITNDNYRYRQFHLLLRPQEVVFGNGYIAPEHRMRGLFPELVRTAIDSYSKDTSFYTTVARLNDVSMKSHQRLGFELRLSLACHRVGASPYFWTAREVGEARRWIAWNQPIISLGQLLAGSGSECNELA